MQNTIYQKLQDLLKSGAGYLDKDGELNLPLIQDKAYQGDADLLDLLLGNPAMQKQFFTQTAKALIFKRDSFIEFISDKNFFADSYTRYKNKIGLGDDKKYLKASQDVVLMFPFKDCVLEGGMSNEEEGKREIFYNETLALDEIDRLFEPKLLSNTKRITADGEQSATGFNRDENGDITDNLLIKGNNLLALHSLKAQFAGKVKLIYIDPPYNTGGDKDPFLYNNRFKRSTWLTFMKNRLDVAKQLLRKDGAMVVAIDENEQAHLGVLLKELFHHEKYEIHCIIIIHNPGGNQGTNFSYTHEYAYFIIPRGKKIIGLQDRNSNPDIRPLRDVSKGDHLREDAKNCFYPIYVKNNEIIGFGEVCPDTFHPNSANIIKDDGVIEIYPIDPSGLERKWVFARQSVEKIISELKVEYNKNRKIYDIKRYKTQFNYKTVWIDKKYDSNENGTKLLRKLLPDCPFSFPKSLYNVYDCIAAVVGTDKDAIILDFFGGSGTTAHAVMELNKKDGGNRQFILCEQMDYIKTVTKARIQKVIQNNAKEISFNGTKNEFIYTELAPLNQTFIDAITQADNTKTLLKIRERVLSADFKQYQLDNEGVQDDETFTGLNLNDQKQALIAILDKN